ncbi:TIGR03085 family metal-binding protein [Nocardioides caldifontis]|uniref:TIGR03085 family metal-binding protein n=1 Tax=Nocardioides caldifontis TaxID=2588938 RepID=UPI0011DF7FC6|nr:TIGR03085 family metal-binding protein [Nocardioides caldifontis]
MTTIAAYERTHLAALAQQLGPDAPTLCEGWSVRDLVVHLVVRERSPAAAGILVRPLAGALDRVSRREAAKDFDDLVTKLRHGPPPWSPFGLPALGDLLNTVELFVHHEDVRRAQPTWQPRALPPKVEDALWRALRAAGRGLTVRTPVGLVAERSDTRERTRLRSRPRGTDRDVLLKGRPSELVLYVYGRKEHAEVVLEGDAEDVASVAGTPMGI